jgi:hypothetical protein
MFTSSTTSPRPYRFWAQVVRQICPDGIRDVGVGIYPSSSVVDIELYDLAALQEFKRKTRELSPDGEIGRLLRHSIVHKTIYTPTEPKM